VAGVFGGVVNVGEIHGLIICCLLNPEHSATGLSFAEGSRLDPMARFRSLHGAKFHARVGEDQPPG
jgi:hypothetical protein